ncbi:SCO family protein [Campylobacter sp. RM9344]|uniref:SCO family protein n=1 Tax=Campylobacter californiensis TaxID=1032243 RepID=A0AAW3ZV36_9BACT|nr:MULTISPECIES: SCO family protein [unclassified Campylobacter]MBE2984924.1 SCO family protein [Campylobacter sp. RM6883]MBE2986357.1 SCO family protein [Campylobacter sp. RM12919]MBE2988012.1 SCO family protein [Campylobacter sp. RM12920]MBE2995300.1 SCO family protein [Campylobacter sp. RM6913]MBE3022385.1 SCO family protein [Campylobacter sp. 7477a]MBE3029365.1 SCO family protein [Campylobacter sp. RM9344]
MKKIFAFLVFVLIIGGAALLLLKPSKYDFKAYSPSGEVSLQSFEGKYKAIYFGYLFCPDVCPTTLSLVGDVLTKLDRNDFELIFITLDPKRDKPEDLTMMAKNFYKDATGLKLLDIDKVTANYGVKFKEIPMPNSEMFYTVAHSSSIYLIDKNGKFYSEISNLTTENIKENILNLIKERP